MKDHFRNLWITIIAIAVVLAVAITIALTVIGFNSLTQEAKLAIGSAALFILMYIFVWLIRH